MNALESHALVVGGTGMLADVALRLAAQGRTVSVIARNSHRLDRLTHRARRYAGCIRPVCVDYNDDPHLRRTLEAVVDQAGAVDLAICWIHSSAPRAIYTVAEVVSSSSASARLIHLRASATTDPSQPDPALTVFMGGLPSLNYEIVTLGFIVECPRSRWLKDSEIVDGVIAAIQHAAPHSVIGVVQPWYLRP